jgi:putative endonuclease
LYIGYTYNLRKRLKEHNLGLVRSTKLKRPLYLVYYEAYASKQDAIKREITLNYERKL